jgi:transcriptional regulator with XRE-family HTH domain
MNDFSKRLREVLEANQISQNELARRINMSHSIINNYCTGKREPSIDVLILICKALGETSDYLIGLAES